MTHSDRAHYPQPSCSCEVVLTAVALRAYAAEICDAEVARALARLEGLSARDAFVVRALAERIVGKVLDRPMTLLPTHPEGASMARVLRRLFQLEPEAGPPGCQRRAPGSCRVDPAARIPLEAHV